MFNGLTRWVIGVINSLRYIGIGGLIAVANLFPPIPSVLILPLAGFLTSRGQLVFTAVVVATAGSVIGALILCALSLPLAWRVCAGSLRGMADGHF
jgi:membrane protein DedA with SNARE-associated domain